MGGVARQLLVLAVCASNDFMCCSTCQCLMDLCFASEVTSSGLPLVYHQSFTKEEEQ